MQFSIAGLKHKHSICKGKL